MSIKAGDLVMVVRLKACGHGLLGKIFEVEAIVPARGGKTMCNECGFTRYESYLACSHGWSHDTGGTYQLDRLKRIPPLDELERDQIVKELTLEQR